MNGKITREHDSEIDSGDDSADDELDMDLDGIPIMEMLNWNNN